MSYFHEEAENFRVRNRRRGIRLQQRGRRNTPEHEREPSDQPLTGSSTQSWDGEPRFLPSLSEVASAVPQHTSTSAFYAIAENALKVHLKKCLERHVRVTLGSWLRIGVGIARSLHRVEEGSELGVEEGSLVLLVDTQKERLYYGEIAETGRRASVILHDGSSEVDGGTTLLLSDGRMTGSEFLEVSAVLGARREPSFLRAPGGNVALRMDGRAELNFLSIDGSRGREWPRVARDLDEDQYEALRTAATRKIVAIHAPLGCGATRFCVTLVKFFADNTDTWFGGRKRPLLLVTDDPAFSSGILPKDVAFGLSGRRFDKMEDEVGGLPEVEAARERFEGVVSSPHVKRLLDEAFASETVVLHQEDLRDVTDRFATTVHADRNFLAEWLFYGSRARTAEGEASKAYDAYCQTHDQVPPKKGTKKYDRSVYLWKKLREVEAAPEAESVDNVYDLEPDERWRLYKHWASRYAESRRKKLLSIAVGALSARRQWTRLLAEKMAAALRETPVVVTDPKTAARRRSLVDVLNPCVVVVLGAQRVEDFLAPVVLGSSTEQLIAIGDDLDPHGTSTFWRRLRTGVVDHDSSRGLNTQYFLPQHICDLLEPCTGGRMRSRVPPANPVPGVIEEVQFFNVADKDAAVFMLSRTAAHFQNSGRQASDVVVLLLGASKETADFVRSVLEVEEVAFGIHDATSFYPARADTVLALVESPAEGRTLSVAASRSTRAFYAFGDFSSADALFQNVLNASREFAEGRLTLECTRHPGTRVVVRTCGDFEAELLPEGFCREPCGTRLSCGHACTLRCHGGDHDGVFCVEPCARVICSRNHRCPLACSDPCQRRCCECFE